MPYIPKKYRPKLDIYLDNILATIIEQSEEIDEEDQFHYVVLYLMKKKYAMIPKHKIKSIPIKILEDTKLEYARRFLGPYEDLKIEMNDDI